MIPGYSAVELARLEQGSPEWLEARKGCVGASSVADAMAMLKRGEGETQARYKLKLQVLAERIGCRMTEHYVSDAMRWGTEMEPLARTAYELRMAVDVDTVGIVAHPSVEWGMCSPDGLVGSDGLIEIKCPMTATHCDYLLADVLPREYEPQVHWQLACTGRAWCDFVSFDPRLPERYQVFRKRVPRDEARIAELEVGVRAFLAEVDLLIARLNAITLDAAPRVKEQLVESLAMTGYFATDRAAMADALFEECR